MTHVSASLFSATGFRLLLALLLLAGRLPAAGQAPAWQTARAVAVATAASNFNASELQATAVDAAGDVYLTGTFRNTVLLGAIALTSVGATDIFVAKFSPATNQFVWAQRAGGTGLDGAEKLAVSGNSVYVTGFYNSPTVDFGATTLTNAGNSDVYVAKLTDTGSFGWALRAGSSGVDFASALVVSGTSVYVAGYFEAPTVRFGTTTLTSAGTMDVFVTKLTDAGPTASFVWAQRAGGADSDLGTVLAVSGANVYVAGYTSSRTAGFGPVTLTNASNAATTDLFVAKLTDAGPTGSFVWAQRAGGALNDFATALAVSGPNVYVGGYFVSPTAAFGATTLTNVGPSGSYDAYVAKLTDAGTSGRFDWTQQVGSTGAESVGELAVSGSSVYVVGSFSTSVSFGSTTLTNGGTGDLFVARLLDAGSTSSFAWAQQGGGSSGYKGAAAVALSGTNVYVAGSFGGLTATFGTIIVANPNYIGTGFLASLADPTLTATAAGRALASAQLFPNPAHGTATLYLPVGATAAPLTLTDALGRTVRRYPAAAAGPEVVLDLRGLSAGLYLVRGAGPAQHLRVE
ncbi:T9SS type A sorting domain-containing protein [Hymenobacter convexus]|uniref:T9SS type A sorting domain-containing protein n=1 Tax=Hymenobacter sp. CA1UV-4 TaxID=3063782 RepID=UPI002712C921|nr:T9SS type A sorting domain-containing protein [Hymenobacter sp. CA1UV-4]MDO7852383.1 T9SS type A sorting domain-containing protein [Hymenobacter sp. CA1UV-4]